MKKDNKADRFDLEEKIMRASWILEDIRLLRDRFCEEHFTDDELDNFLMAMETIYTHRFDDLDDMMCRVFELNQYAPTKFDVKREQPRFTDDEHRQMDLFYGMTEDSKKFKPEHGFYNGRNGVWYGN